MLTLQAFLGISCRFVIMNNKNIIINKKDAISKMMPLHSDTPAINTTEILPSKLDLSRGISSLENTVNRALEAIQTSEWLYVCASFQWLRTLD